MILFATSTSATRVRAKKTAKSLFWSVRKMDHKNCSTALLHDDCALPACGKAHSLLADIKLHIVLPHENVTQDPQRTPRSWNVDAHHAEEALTTRVLEDHVGLIQNEVLAVHRECDCVFLAAIHHVLLSENALEAQRVSDDFHIRCGSCHQAGPRIDNCKRCASNAGVIQLQAIQRDLPI